MVHALTIQVCREKSNDFLKTNFRLKSIVKAKEKFSLIFIFGKISFHIFLLYFCPNDLIHISLTRMPRFSGSIGSFNIQFLTSWKYERSDVSFHFTLLCRAAIRNKRRKFSNGFTQSWVSPFQREIMRTSWRMELFCANSPTKWFPDRWRKFKNAAQTSSWWKMFRGVNI